MIVPVKLDIPEKYVLVKQISSTYFRKFTEFS